MSSAPPSSANRSRQGPRSPRPPRRQPPTQEMLEARMSLVAHLRELRDRLIRIALSITLTTALSFIFVDPLFKVFLRLAPANLGLQGQEPAEIFGSYFKIALTFGIAAAMPLIIYQIFRFLSPGLMPNERRWIILALPIITIFFVCGVIFCYFVLLPPAINFLFSFGDERIARIWRISSYIGFITNFLLAAGLTFQLPPVMFMLAKIGIVNAKKLGGFRRYAIVIAAIGAAIITPTTDPFNMMLLAVPMYLLYELGVIMARFA